MKKSLLLGALMLLFGFSASAQKSDLTFERPDYEAICEAINTDNLEHPYLFFSKEDVPVMLERIESTPHMKRIFEMLKVHGDLYMKIDADPDPVLNDLRSRFLGTDVYAANQGYFQAGSVTLALLYQLTGDEAYAQRAYELTERLCQLDTWRMVAHAFEVIYDRVWPLGAEDEQVAFGFDLWTGDTATDVAMVYDWIYPALSERQRDRIRGGLLDNAILRVRGNYEYQWWASAYHCNWAGICYNGLGLSSLALLTENPELIDVVVRSCEGIEGMVSNITPQGGWIEGRHYSVYGLCQSMMFMDAIKRMSDGKINLFTIDGIYNAPADFALYGLGASFGDGSFVDKFGKAIGSPGMYGKLAAESGNTTAMYYVENYLPRPMDYFGGRRNNTMNSIWDLIWPMPDIEGVKPAEASRHFTEIDWVVMRKDWGDEYVQLAAKCGPANDPHHGHLDAGSFNIGWKGEQLMGEMPQRFYDQSFFNDCRWEYLDVRSSGHNTVIVNGEEQVSGKRKDQPWRDKGGEVTRFESLPTYAYTQMDATNAYDNIHLKGWERTLILDKENNITLVLDQVTAAPGSSIELLFHPTSTATVSDKGVVEFKGERATQQMEMRSTLPITLALEDQVDYRIFKTKPFVTIPCLYARATSEQQESLFGTIFYPDGASEAVAFTLDQSGKNPVLRYQVDGKAMGFEVSDMGVTAI